MRFLFCPTVHKLATNRERRGNPEEVIEVVDLSTVATCDLVAALEKRQGVQLERVDPYKPYAIDVEGPVIVLIITD